jgi:ABC-type enterobactin transport system permease subunit
MCRLPRALSGLLAIAVLAPACAVVAPYERERLARPDMELGRNADVSAGEEHATAYREGSTGATGTSGGGCGCN